MTAPSNIIKLGHARDHLRQHFAIDAGLESMDHRPLGSALKDVDLELREECRKQMQQCRDNAHWEISGMIHGTKIAVWKERPDGELVPAGAEWAKGMFDAKGIMPAALYFDRAEWEALLVSMTTAESRAYFAEASSRRESTVRSLPAAPKRQMIAGEAGLTREWTPIEQAGKYGGPIVLIERKPVIRRLQDGLIASRAKLAVTVHRPKIFADTSHIKDKLAAALAGQQFQWGEPVEERESYVELPASYWVSDKLGHAWLDLWNSGDARLESTDGNERASFYGLQLLDTANPNALASTVRNGGNMIGSAGSAPEFDNAKPDWLELWQGPIHFRATYENGHFGPGHSLDRINQYGLDGATGGGRHAPIYSVRLDTDDGALVIEWLIGLPGRHAPFSMVRYYHGGLGRGLYDRLRTDPTFRDQQLAFLPADQRERAVGAYACAITIREWAEREFFNALHAKHCEIWARVGSKIAPFRRIPADIFRAYEIQEWGYGVPGGAWARLDDAESLYAVHVAPVSATLEGLSGTFTSGKTSSRRGRTKGTGFQYADALLLNEMQKSIEADPSLNATAAAKLVAQRAKGASFEAKVDRLARAFRAGRNGE